MSDLDKTHAEAWIRFNNTIPPGYFHNTTRTRFFELVRLGVPAPDSYNHYTPYSELELRWAAQEVTIILYMNGSVSLRHNTKDGVAARNVERQEPLPEDHLTFARLVIKPGVPPGAHITDEFRESVWYALYAHWCAVTEKTLPRAVLDRLVELDRLDVAFPSHTIPGEDGVMLCWPRHRQLFIRFDGRCVSAWQRAGEFHTQEILKHERLHEPLLFGPTPA